MAANDRKGQLQLEVSAVLAHLQINAGVLAQMGPSDRIEIEIEDGRWPTVRFEVLDNVIALGRATDHEGRLAATIFWTGCEPGGRRSDAWSLKGQTAQEVSNKKSANES